MGKKINDFILKNKVLRGLSYFCPASATDFVQLAHEEYGNIDYKIRCDFFNVIFFVICFV